MDIVYVVHEPPPPKGEGLKNAVCKIWTISYDNSETVRDRMSVAILITNMKSHTGLIPTTSMTLNDLEWRNSPYFAFFSPNSIALQADYVTVVEDIPTYNVRKYCLPVSVFHFWPKLTHPAARSLCDSWSSCKFLYPYTVQWHFRTAVLSKLPVCLLLTYVERLTILTAVNCYNCV